MYVFSWRNIYSILLFRVESLFFWRSRSQVAQSRQLTSLPSFQRVMKLYLLNHVLFFLATWLFSTVASLPTMQKKISGLSQVWSLLWSLTISIQPFAKIFSPFIRDSALTVLSWTLLLSGLNYTFESLDQRRIPFHSQFQFVLLDVCGPSVFKLGNSHVAHWVKMHHYYISWNVKA